MTGGILGHFERLCATQPRKTALFSLSEKRTLTIEDLAAESSGVVETLDRQGLPERAVVLCLAGNRTAFVSTLLACLQKKLVFVPLDDKTSAAEVKALRDRFGASALVTSDAQVEALPSRGAGTDMGDAVLLKLTSGSTGLPKAVAVTEEQLCNDGRHVIQAMGIGTEDVNLGLIPVSHSYGLGNLVLPLLLQGTSLVLRTSFVPSLLHEDVETTGATVFPGVPFMFQYFQDEALAALPSSLRLLITAGARIDEKTVRYFAEHLGQKIHSFYGTSETGGITYDDAETISEPLSLGHQVPETEVSFRDGRVFVRGSAVASGYFRPEPEDETAARFVDGGFLTGDLGSFDAAGALVLSGRISSFVNVAGRKVSPEEIERVLLEMGAVTGAKVVGVPCEKRGQKLLACVVPRTEALRAIEIRQHCARRLPPHKVPHEILLVPELPVDARGKLSLEALEAVYVPRPNQPFVISSN